jgi:hypothetical protein
MVEAPDRKLRCLNWCSGSEMREVGLFHLNLWARSSNAGIRVLVKSSDPPGYCADCSRLTGRVENPAARSGPHAGLLGTVSGSTR